MTYEAAEIAPEIGVDGLTHLFIDRGADSSILDTLRGVFIIPRLYLKATIFGNKPTASALDPRVREKLPPAWLAPLEGGTDTFAESDFDTVLKTEADLRPAGIDNPGGFKPIEALRAAMSVPARCFWLTDRGRIVEGLRGGLLLVQGDPMSDIRDTLSIRTIWRRDSELDSTPL
ncbi:hypothetical protein AYL99_05510 [Fonsecaea erecta]|uniref:Uncharacterized protein n=1 Tax=Fonsecaea erecta TaxID=1367422 RepID=A0A178ZL36_9EURO|nr:hypothetical protein AYL99_05510 [Fonsecaea erecta]OAP60508.1 hypothetical protein AYL99_05510 [Fonsecaea erecta]